MFSRPTSGFGNPGSCEAHPSVKTAHVRVCRKPGIATSLQLGVLIGLLAFAVVLTLPSTLQAADEVVNFDNPAHKQMYQTLLKEYRCLKCQNQNLWDSNASLAGDLRREIREQIIAGKDKADIDEYLVSRYGEFVLYRPPFSAKTAILWIGPFVLLFIGLGSLLLMVRSKSKLARDSQDGVSATPPAELYSEDKLAKARDLLKD